MVLNTTNGIFDVWSVARSAGFANVFAWLVLGFRCAPPQALRCRPLRGLCQCFCMADPGVSLRSTPGFTLSPRSAGLFVLINYSLGFLFAPPQALCCHPLRGLLTDRAGSTAKPLALEACSMLHSPAW